MARTMCAPCASYARRKGSTMPNGKTVPCPVSWACTDCLMVLANGEYPPDQTGAERAEYRSRMDTTIGDLEITIGMLASEHADDCPVRIEDSHGAVDECDCETNSFSWSACDVCGSNLGGERHAVTYWTEEAS